MGNVKAFFLGYVVIYMVVAISLNAILGPPGMSKEYLSEFKSDHDHFIEITKRDDYKRWSERPELNPPTETLEAAIGFVEEYESRPGFQAEEHRRHRYDIIFDIFNMSMVVVLIMRFARKPLGNLLDGMIDQIRETLEMVEAARNNAHQRKAEAQSNVNRLDQEQADQEAEAEKRIEVMRREAALSTGESLSALNRETEDRKLNEAALARRALKEELVEAALASLEQQVQDTPSSERENKSIDRFVSGLEKRS